MNLPAYLLPMIIALVSISPVHSEQLKTPIEQINYVRISSSEEISAYLDALVAKTTLSRKEIIGSSVEGRPLEALVLSTQSNNQLKSAAASRLTLLLVGSQHGAAEPAGGEALLAMARELALGDLRPLLADIDIVIVPNANPDGRDAMHRSNANRVNINTDFVLSIQPETQALERALSRYLPEVVLDSHESAVLKRKSLAREGYLTDFNAQFEVANNPAIAKDMLQFMSAELMPVLLARVTAAGLPARRYIGEITSTQQPITNGGLTLRNFRNTAGLTGAVSFLVETKLDSREDSFPTYRNIGPRIERQLICLRTFIQLMYERRFGILRKVAENRMAMQAEPVPLYVHYVRDLSHPRVDIPLRRLDSRKLESLAFYDHRSLEISDVIAMPKALVIVKHIDKFKALLDRHAFQYRILKEPMFAEVIGSRFEIRPGVQWREKVLESTTKPMTVPAGALYIDLAQADGRLIVLLLDPRSTSSVFRYPEFAQLTDSKTEHFVYPIVDRISSNISGLSDVQPHSNPPAL